MTSPPEDLMKELDDSITELIRFSNVGQIFLCKTPARFDHHNINTKVCLFNKMLVEHFLDTEDFLTVVDTVQPEIKFYYPDGLHLSNLGIAKLCGIILSKLYKVLDPASHRSPVRSRQNRNASDRRHSNSKGMVELVINRHMGHTVYLTLGAGMYNTSKQPFYISNP